MPGRLSFSRWHRSLLPFEGVLATGPPLFPFLHFFLFLNGVNLASTISILNFVQSFSNVAGETVCEVQPKYSVTSPPRNPGASFIFSIM